MASKDKAALYRITVTDSPVGVSVTTPDGRVLAVDRALCELLGCPAAQLLTGDGREVPFPGFGGPLRPGWKAQVCLGDHARHD
jgi:PAS domain-containing protein